MVRGLKPLLLISWMLVFGLVLGVSAPAFAKSKSGISSVLGDLEWGASKSKVLEHIKQMKLDALKKNKSLRKNPAAMQKARKRLDDWHKKVEESYVRFKKNNKDSKFYEVSIVAGHYTDNNGETMLVAKDNIAQRFFFFIDGKLYKLVVAYNRDYLKNIGFEAFVGQSAKKYGRPVSVEYGDIMGDEELLRVTWRDKGSQLEVENMFEFFGTYTMVFSDRQKLKHLNASNRVFGGSDRVEEEGISNEVASLTKEDSYDRNEDVVDSIVGDVEIDLNEGRPKDQQVREPDPAEAPKAKKGKKKKKSKKARPKATRKKKKRIKKNEFDAGDEELIIY